MDETLPDLVYYDFVTLTTVVCGDVYPGAQAGRFPALTEAITGQF